GHRVQGPLVGRQRPRERGRERAGRHVLAHLAADAALRVHVHVAGAPETVHARSEPLAGGAPRRSRRRTPTTVKRPAPATSALSSTGRTWTTSPGPTTCVDSPSRTWPSPSSTVNTVSASSPSGATSDWPACR